MTVLSQAKEKKNFADKDDAIGTRSMVEKKPVSSTSTSGVLEKKCIFCNGSGRKHFTSSFEMLSPCQTLQAQESILNAGRQLKDVDLLREYEHVDIIAKEVHYHNTCRVRYVSRGARAETQETETTCTQK